jgi:hypothetical protein
MAFQRKQWTDRLVETPNRRKLVNVATEEETIVDITREEGNVLAVGDRFDEANMNNLELRIKEGFDTLAEVSRTGEYKDLNNTPTSLPANGGEADSIKGLGDAEAIKEIIKASGGDNVIRADYEEGDLPLFETPFNIRFKPKDGSIVQSPPMIAKYSDNEDKISTAITFADDGMEFFNAKIQPTRTTCYVDNIEKSGYITKFEDGSTISAKAVFEAGVFKGFKYSNGKYWIIENASGDMPEF